MSNRMTFSLASLILLIAFGLVATPAMAQEVALPVDTIADIRVVQGTAIDITLPTATGHAGSDGALTATLTPLDGTAVQPTATDPPTAETGGPLQGLAFTFDAETGVGMLKGNANPNLVTLIEITYTVTQAAGNSVPATSPVTAVDASSDTLTFFFEVTTQPDPLEFPAGTRIADQSLTEGTYFYEVLPAAQDGVGPVMYSIVGAEETPADSGLYGAGTSNLPTGISFNPETRVLSGTPNAAADRKGVTYQVTDTASTSPSREATTLTLSFTIEVAARVNGPVFAIKQVADAAYTKDHMITAMKLPAADITNALGTVSYTLTGLPKGLTFAAATRELSGTPTDDSVTSAAVDFTATYTAMDQSGNEAEIPFKITVNPVVSITAPDVMRVLGASPSVGITVPAATGGTAPVTVMVDASTLPAGLMVADGKITGDPTATGESTVTINAEDSLGATGTGTFMITVEAAPDIVFTSENLVKLVTPRTYEAGTPITPEVLPTATGGVGELSYTLDVPAGLNFNPATHLLTGTPTTAAATANYNYVVTDDAFGHIDDEDRTADHPANMLSVSLTITVTAPAPVTNSAPDFGTQTIANIVATANTAIPGRFLPEATDADNDSLTYSLSPAPPAGIMFDPATRALTGTPTAVMAETAHTYMVSDGNGGSDTIGFFITVNAAPVDPPDPPVTNMPPAFADDASIDNIVATAGTSIQGRFLPEATDPEGDAVTYFVSPALPRGLIFNPATRALTGTPTAAMTQTPYTYTARATGGTDTISFFITVNAAPPPPNRAPIYPDTPVAITGTVGVAITPAILTAVDPDGDVLSYSWDVDEDALGLMLNTSTGIITGTPLEAYTGSHPVTASDGSLSAMRDVTVTISAAPPVNVAPVVTITTKAPAVDQMNSFAVAYTVTDANGDTPVVGISFAVSPSTATGYTIDDSVDEMVTITQAAGSPTAVVMVEITATDAGGLSDSDSIEVTFAARGTAPVDTTPPTVVISIAPAPAGPNVHADTLRVTLNFNEQIQPDTIDIGRAATDAPVLQISDPMVSATDNTIYTVDVLSEGYRTRATTSVLLKRGVKDLAGNATTSDMVGTYTRPAPPVATVAITGPASLNCETGDSIRVAVTGTTEKLVAGDITISAGWKMGTDKDPSDGMFDLVPDGNNAIGVTSVAVGVKANAVSNNKAASKTFTVGPILTIPAGGYIVVIRPEHMSSTHLNDPLYLGSLGVRGLPVSIQGWDCMPDLTVFFGRSAPGSGGGALVVKQSHAHTGAAIGKGSVGISEIMWASDEGTIHGLTSNTMQAREQWIELHNTNNREVKVTLFARPTNTALVNEGAAELDRMSNYNIGGAWVVKGQSGNSALGTNFVSMWRHKNAKLYSHGENSGTNGGKWNASTLVYRTRGSLLAGRGATNPTYNFVGTPGRSNTIGPVSPPVKTNVPKSVVFNEVANRRDQTLEWIELKNTTTGTINLRNYHISFVTGVDSEKPFYTFPNNDSTKIGPGELLLLVDTDMRYNDDHPVAVGRNIHGGNDQAMGIGADAPRYMITDFAEGGLPDDGNFILFLRRPDGHDKAGTAANKRGTDKNMIDLAGYAPNLAKQGAPLYTNLWPLKVFGGPNSHNKMEVETVHRRQHVSRDPSQVPDNKAGNAAIGQVGYTGIGYKRHAQNRPAHGGTPGHPHSWTDLGAGTTTAVGHLTISEIMLDQGDGRYPQWIEIYNGSDQNVNLRGGKTGWKLKIYNYDDGVIPIARLSGTLNFRNSQIHMLPPGQTVLIASTRARSSGSAFFDTSVVFPPTRVFSVWDDARGELGQARSTDPIISSEGFYIELIDGGNDARTGGYVSDAVGNLLPNPGRRVATQNTIKWQLSEITGEMMDDAPRSSIMRRYRKPMGGDFRDPRTNAVTWPKYSATELFSMGIMAEGWILASKTDFRDVSQTWYGDRDDIGSPGISTGRVLPVELSTFRPERNPEDGSVAIRWVTESETNNAGFNILRSDSKAGEFTKLNTQLIAGQDTTSERTAYEFVDKTAKPNVIYYYQIQDVSLDGDVSTLQVTHLRGHVSAAGKATTTWGDIKSLQ